MIRKIISIIAVRLGIIKRSKKTFVEIPGTIIYGDPNLITIGRKVSFGGNVLLYSNARISIGDYSMIAINVTLHTSTHDYNLHPMRTLRIDKPITIGKHVWIGTGAIVIPGIIVEDYAVIAAGTVVTANVPKGAIVAGNPARIIKFRDPVIYNATNINLDIEGTPVVGDFCTKYCKEVK